MIISRRQFTVGAASALTAPDLFKPAFAESEPIRIGWLAAMTGPSSAPAIGFDRGVRYAVDAANAAGASRAARSS
jgi:branched-chain amino acid transport system substrate-binding protein